MQQAVKAVKTEAVTPSATSASAPPPWTRRRNPNEEALRVKALKEVAKRLAGDELQSSAKRHKTPPWQQLELSADMEESTDDEVQEEVKEEEDSEDPSSDDEEDWLAKGPRGDFAHGCPSEL